MRSVRMLQARSSLTRLVEAIERRRERGIATAPNGRPAAKLVPMDTLHATQRIGIARDLSRYATTTPSLRVDDSVNPTTAIGRKSPSPSRGCATQIGCLPRYSPSARSVASCRASKLSRASVTA